MDILAVVGGGGGEAVETGNIGDAGAWLLLWFYLGLALSVSFLCSLLEAALLSIPQPYVRVLVQEGRKSGLMLERMKHNIDRPLAAILTLNTVAHTMGAAGTGAQILIIFGNAWVAAGSVVITLLILVFSEIIPKSLGAAHAKRFAGFAAYTIQWMVWGIYPVVLALEAISRRLGPGGATLMTREEVRVVAELGKDAGALKDLEWNVIHNLLRLREVKVEDVMTPRAVAFLLPADTTVEETLERHNPLRFSRIPIFRDTPDHLVGLVQRQALLHAARDGQNQHRLIHFAQPIHSIPESASVAAALDQFIARGDHLFQAVDEFGGTAGIITLEDALETLLGVEIVDETDSVKDMRKLAHQLVEKRRERREPLHKTQ